MVLLTTYYHNGEIVHVREKWLSVHEKCLRFRILGLLFACPFTVHALIWMLMKREKNKANSVIELGGVIWLFRHLIWLYVYMCIHCSCVRLDGNQERENKANSIIELLGGVSRIKGTKHTSLSNNRKL